MFLHLRSRRFLHRLIAMCTSRKNRSENRNFTVQVKRNMTENQVKPKKSKMKILIYVILGLVLLTVFLEMSGVADVAGKRETETIIDRPHQ